MLGGIPSAEVMYITLFDLPNSWLRTRGHECRYHTAERCTWKVLSCKPRYHPRLVIEHSSYQNVRANDGGLIRFQHVAMSNERWAAEFLGGSLVTTNDFAIACRSRLLRITPRYEWLLTSSFP